MIGKRLKITFSDTISASLLKDIYEEHGPVVIIKNFIRKEALPGILSQLHQSNPATIETDTFGYCYGINLMPARSFDAYLDQEPGFTQYLQNIGLDYDKFIKAKLQPGEFIPVERVHAGDKKYISSTIRFLKPKHGGIKPHTELLHYELFDTSKHISTLLDLRNEISAFCVLQKPEKGGYLRIFNCTFRETEAIPYPELRYEYVLNSGYKDINPEPGDLVLFGGGQRWHCITEIEGNTDRITIGNFFCFNKENNKVLYWS